VFPLTYILISRVWNFRYSQSGWPMTVGCILGASIPDFPYYAQYFKEKVLGSRLETETSQLWQATEISHALLLWIFLYCSVRMFWPDQKAEASWVGRSFCLSGMHHVMLDALTHGHGANFYGTNYFWPLPEVVSSWIGIWNHNPNNPLTPKLEEVVIDLLLLALVLWLRHRRKTEPERQLLAWARAAGEQ